MVKYGHWINAPRITPKNKVGFVYQITNIKTGKKYIGIKKFWKTIKKKPGKYKKKDGKFVYDKNGKRVLETRTNKKHIKVETNWRSYNGSGNFTDVINKHPTWFKKEILQICSTITELKLEEAHIQLDYWKSGCWNDLYNEEINVRLRIRKDNNISCAK